MSGWLVAEIHQIQLGYEPPWMTSHAAICPSPINGRGEEPESIPRLSCRLLPATHLMTKANDAWLMVCGVLSVNPKRCRLQPTTELAPASRTEPL